MSIIPIRKIDRLILSEFAPFFIMGVAGFTLLMIAATQMRDLLKYVSDYGLSLSQVGMFFLYALPQTVVYTFPMATLFSALMSFGRLSDTEQITALRAGGIGFFRILLPALIFAWMVVLLTFLLNENIAPKSTLLAKQHIQTALIDKGIHEQKSDISYLDNDAGWLFAAASAQGNTFKDVKWVDFSRHDVITLTISDEAQWMETGWEFYNATVITIPVNGSISRDEAMSEAEKVMSENTKNLNTNLVRLTSPKLEIKINRLPSDVLASESKRDPQEMSLQEIQKYLQSDASKELTERAVRKILGTYHTKISVPFASLLFTLIAAPLGLSPQRSSSTRGVGVSLLLVFGYYILTTFSIKIAESGVLSPVLAAWIPNLIFLIAGTILISRFYLRSS